ncbi:MAG: LPS translocon maturation chaperone LptM [Xanthobacteraceae bacterium]
MASGSLRWSHAAAVAALVAALGLSACGRKGPLDPPPSAEASMQAAPGTPVNPLERNRSRRQPPPPKRNDPFFLDFLLN